MGIESFLGRSRRVTLSWGRTVAAIIGCRQAILLDMERGRYNPSLELLGRLAQALDEAFLAQDLLLLSIAKVAVDMRSVLLEKPPKRAAPF